MLDRYACGWVKKEPNAEIPHTVYWHNGSNTMWYALVVFIPEKNMVVAVTSNDTSLRARIQAWIDCMQRSWGELAKAEDHIRRRR